ncbi:DUF3000 domain-containing protein [Streptomyces sp. NPDC059740]|uniref:DUF3000 domain-containing protein n=1 Tax=Streptomyces sp. NPDC059740 TaxID=3346926 RepID=UPI00365A6888
MAAAHGHFPNGSDPGQAGGRTTGADGTTDADDAGSVAAVLFRRAVETLHGVRPRPEISTGVLPAPKRMAPHAYAMQVSVVDPAGDPDEELADGRFVLLHDPAGQDAWRGRFRVVTLARADLEPEMGNDPLLPEVSWSWLTGALQARGAAYDEPGGTVTRAGSHFFGSLGDREATTELEMRASWTPAEVGEVPALGPHLEAWCDLLCQLAGLPPVTVEQGTPGGVVPLPQRRGPHAR